MSSKRQPSKRDKIPVHLRGRRKVVDPRFDEQFGEYNAKEFRESYHFITDMRRKELKVRYVLVYKIVPRLFSLKQLRNLKNN